METKTKNILDIGCGIYKMPEAMGLDIDPNSSADIIHNLNVYPYPVESNAFDEIYAKHIIEHVDDPSAFIKEIYRMLKPGGTVFIETPHFSCRVAYSEYQHKMFASYFIFNNLLEGTDFKILKQEITFHKSFRRVGIRWLANKYPDAYERFWTFMFPAENVTLLAQKPEA